MKKVQTILPYILQKIVYSMFFYLYKFFLKLEIRGQGNLEKERGPFIFAMNHVHELDSTLFPLMLPFWSQHFPLFVVAAKKERYKTFGWRGYFYGGRFFNAVGAYSVFSGQYNYAYALQNHEKILNKGYSVCIFPEGKITLDGKVGPAHGGIGYLAYATGAKVVPVAVSGFYELSLSDFFLRKRKAVLTIGDPLELSISEPSKEACTEAGEVVMEEIKKMLL